MPLFSIPELREEARKNRPIIAISHSDLGAGDATHILNAWAIDLENYANALGFSVLDIAGSDLTYERITKILTETKPAVLFNFGHGCQDFLIGNDGRCMLTNGFVDMYSCGTCGKPSNLNVLKDVAVVAFSCNTGVQLGKCAVKYGSPAYVGFADNLVIVSDAYRTQDIFRNALLPLAMRILEGQTIGDATNATRTDLINTVKLYKPIELISVPLWYNKKYLVQLGNPDWKLI